MGITRRLPALARSRLWLPMTMVLLGVLLADSSAVSDIKPKRAKAQRRKAAESFPPLPLPATPLRRTEKKRPPAPPLLIARIKYGKMRQRVFDGHTYRFQDWNTDEGSIQSLLFEARRRLGVRYRVDNLALRDLAGDPAQLPIVYLTGHVNISLSAEEKAKLKRYVEAGGFLWGEACCGAREFGESFKALVSELFPGRGLNPLPPDHALYHAYDNLAKGNLSYSREAKKEISDGMPRLSGLDLGCRTAVIFSPFDLSCGWDNHDHENQKTDVPFRAVLRGDAKRLGVNMIAYCLGYHRLGRFLSRRKVFYEEGSPTGGDFVFGQIIHQGNWDPDPSAAINLLTALKETTSSRVRYTRRSVRLDSPEVFDLPFLYITGHEDFRLNDAEVSGLARFLAGGGFLLADACCGREDFAIAFRREIARALPGKSLAPLGPKHEIFSSLFEIHSVEYTPRLKLEQPELAAPRLEGIAIEGAVRVLFSPYDLGNGWEGVDHPFTRGYSAKDALRLGVNAVVYSLTH